MNNFTSVLKQLQQERTRLTSQLENLNGAISALNGKSPNRRNCFRRRSCADRCCATGSLGQGKRGERRLHRPGWEAKDVSRCNRTYPSRTESTLGEVAKGTEEGLVARVVPIPQHEKHACVAGLELLSKGLNIAVVLGPSNRMYR
jgi:hypothetical protein